MFQQFLLEDVLAEEHFEEFLDNRKRSFESQEDLMSFWLQNGGIIRRYWIFPFAKKLAKVGYTIDDLLQEAFLYLLKSYQTYDPKRVDVLPSSYFGRIVKNRMLELIRIAENRGYPELCEDPYDLAFEACLVVPNGEDEAEEAVFDGSEFVDDMLSAKELLEKLHSVCASEDDHFLIDYLAQGFSQADAAKVLHVTRNSVCARLRRLRARYYELVSKAI